MSIVIDNLRKIQNHDSHAHKNEHMLKTFLMLCRNQADESINSKEKSKTVQSYLE